MRCSRPLFWLSVSFLVASVYSLPDTLPGPRYDAEHDVSTTTITPPPPPLASQKHAETLQDIMQETPLVQTPLGMASGAADPAAAAPRVVKPPTF